MPSSCAKHLRLAAVALSLELCLCALVVFRPGMDWEVVFGPFLLPGALAGFLAGGGVSMVDGAAPEWRVAFALALEFVVNTAILYVACSVFVRIFRELRPHFARTPPRPFPNTTRRVPPA